MRNLMLSCLLASVSSGAAAGGGESADEVYARLKGMSGKEIVALLKQLIPVSPAYPTIQSRVAMSFAATTKRLDAALLLIECLAFNENPMHDLEGYIPPDTLEEMRARGDLKTLKYLESLGVTPMTIQAMLIQAIQELERHYGAQALPLLFVKGIGTDKQWMRERCALAVRVIGKEEEIRRLRAVFSLDDSENPGAKEFAELLDAEELQVYIYEAGREHFRRGMEAYLEGRRADAETPEEKAGWTKKLESLKTPAIRSVPGPATDNRGNEDR